MKEPEAKTEETQSAGSSAGVPCKISAVVNRFEELKQQVPVE